MIQNFFVIFGSALGIDFNNFLFGIKVLQHFAGNFALVHVTLLHENQDDFFAKLMKIYLMW